MDPLRFLKETLHLITHHHSAGLDILRAPGAHAPPTYPRDMDPDIARCRICGLRYEDDLPWGPDGQVSSFNICDCCGVTFGYEDGIPAAARKYRAAWVTGGALWSYPKAQPVGWDLQEQLRHVPSTYQ
jgi:hypothetical protein